MEQPDPSLDRLTTTNPSLAVLLLSARLAYNANSKAAEGTAREATKVAVEGNHQIHMSVAEAVRYGAAESLPSEPMEDQAEASSPVASAVTTTSNPKRTRRN